MHQPLQCQVSPTPGHQQQRALRRGLWWLPGDHIPTPRRCHLPRTHPHYLPAANRRGSLRALRGGPSRASHRSISASGDDGKAGGSNWESCTPGHHPTWATVCPKVLLYLFFPMDTSMQFIPLWEAVDILRCAQSGLKKQQRKLKMQIEGGADGHQPQCWVVSGCKGELGMLSTCERQVHVCIFSFCL